MFDKILVLLLGAVRSFELCEVEPVLARAPITYEYNRTHSQGAIHEIELNDIRYFLHSPEPDGAGSFANGCHLWCTLRDKECREEVEEEGLWVDGSLVTVETDFNVEGEYCVICEGWHEDNPYSASNQLFLVCDQTVWEAIEEGIWTAVIITITAVALLAGAGLLLLAVVAGGSGVTGAPILGSGIAVYLNSSKAAGIAMMIVGGLIFLPFTIVVILPLVLTVLVFALAALAMVALLLLANSGLIICITVVLYLSSNAVRSRINSVFSFSADLSPEIDVSDFFATLIPDMQV